MTSFTTPLGEASTMSCQNLSTAPDRWLASASSRWRPLFFAALMALLLGAARVQAGELTLSAGTVTLQPNQSGQTINIQISGGAAIAGCDVEITLGHSAFKVTAVNAGTGTIWAGNSAPSNPSGLNTNQVLQSVVTNSGSVTAAGTLFVLTVDTTGVPGGTYPLSFTYYGFYTELAEEIPTTAVDGTIIIPGGSPTPTVTITATDAEAAEGTPANPGTFTITRTGATTSALTVSFTVSGTAIAGSDYTALGTSVTIPAGQASATLTVTPIDDTTVESAETVIVTLAAGTGYTLGTPSSATVTIADNDGAVTVTIAATDAEAAEGTPANTGTFTITR
ncbi:MAG: Calx-beta domain-containing protein, partial [Planctomycetota bacterium]|nr:Calx-beta domain-containing protein [Planctomycetota bacterium]